MLIVTLVKVTKPMLSTPQTFTGESTPEGATYFLLPEVKQPYPGRQKAWVRNGGNV